jgi:hypothetical protein
MNLRHWRMITAVFLFLLWLSGCTLVEIYPVLEKPAAGPEISAKAQAVTGLNDQHKPPEAFRSVLDDLFVLQDYRPQKNSFVESPTRHINAWTAPGFRYTLLDAKGSGSIRHIWSTRYESPPYFDWEFYIDDEKNPSIRATMADLLQAAERFPLPLAPANAVTVNKRDFNFYLPIPFERSIRVDVVQREPVGLWFCQIDYRLNDDSMRGIRVIGSRDGDDFNLSYVGNSQIGKRTSTSFIEPEKHKFQQIVLTPGEERAILTLRGPAILRELRLRWQENTHLRLLMRYDHARDFAVNAPVSAFFGPFKGTAFYQHKEYDSSCYLPMPFADTCEIIIRNEGDQDANLSGFVAVEPVKNFSPSWGYFHALHQRTEKTNGHRPHQVLYLRGRGHWLGMTLYKTGHDHGGGDFAVVDGEGETPAFLHGINGEDYFTFAWFGRGTHHPYAEAHSNDAGRQRLHLENVYPFRQSFALEWGAFPNLSPESVAFWYQDSPENTTLPDGAREDSVLWDVFGPVPSPFDKQGRTADDPFAVLPSVEALDRGETFEVRLLEERFTSGWMQDWSVGPMLNLTYIGRHGTEIAGEVELGGMGHAFLARRVMHSEQSQTRMITFAHDDPIQVWVNGLLMYEGGQFFNGFETVKFPITLQAGSNEVVVKLTNYFNRNFNWAGFLLRGLE